MRKVCKCPHGDLRIQPLATRVIQARAPASDQQVSIPCPVFHKLPDPMLCHGDVTRNTSSTSLPPPLRRRPLLPQLPRMPSWSFLPSLLAATVPAPSPHFPCNNPEDLPGMNVSSSLHRTHPKTMGAQVLCRRRCCGYCTALDTQTQEAHWGVLLEHSAQGRRRSLEDWVLTTWSLRRCCVTGMRFPTDATARPTYKVPHMLAHKLLAWLALCREEQIA